MRKWDVKIPLHSRIRARLAHVRRLAYFLPREYFPPEFLGNLAGDLGLHIGPIY